MEALQLDSSKKQLSLQRLPRPVVSKEDDVLVEVAYSGLCGTDLHIISGEFPCCPRPYTPGHEFSGVVRETGPAVIHVKPGDRVVVDPQNWCTTCHYCTTGKYHLCTEGGVELATGIFFDGGWAQFARVRARQVYELPSALSLKQGALCEPFSCMVWALSRGVQDTHIGANILIIGAGIIGNLWSAALHHMGHRNVTVCEPSPVRRKINERLETGYETISPDELTAKIEAGWRSDLTIDCSGNGSAISQGIAALRSSGKMCIFGVASPHTKISVSPFDIYKKELTIFGCNVNPYSMKGAIGLMAAMGPRYVNYDRLGAREYPLSKYAEGMEALRKTEISKVIFTINPNLE